MNSKTDKAEIALRQLLIRHAGEVMMGHVWISEHDRWLELVFALFCAVSASKQSTLRALTAELDSLKLLDVKRVAQGEIWTDLCLPVVSRWGVSEADGKAVMEAVRGAAAVLTSHHGGKLQKLLRVHAEQLITSVAAELRLQALSSEQSRIALVYWLQNVMSLPIALPDGSIERFAAKNGTTPESILEAADELDLNLGFVDDLLWQDAKSQERDSFDQGPEQ